jgi:flagellar basal-body rod modification protein FlgD
MSVITTATNTPAASSAASAAATSTSAADQARSTLGKDMNTFLTLLTTQLQHQDPLSPMDSNQFTQQLVAFSGVEQQITTNKNLENMISSLASQQMAGAVSYLGAQVTANTNQGQLSNGQASWTYSLASTADAANITIKNSQGVTVYTGSGDAGAGSHTFNWNGKGMNGSTVPDGTYNMSVSAATADGTGVTAGVFQTGKVTSVDTANGVSQLSLNGILVPMSSVIAVGLPQTASSSTTVK